MEPKKAKQLLDDLDKAQDILLQTKMIVTATLAQVVPEVELEAEKELVDTLDRLCLASKSLERAFGELSQFAR